MSSAVTQDIESLFESVLDLAVSPLVLELSGEAKQPIELRAIALPSGHSIEKSRHFSNEESNGGILAHGEVRVLLKGTSYPCSFEIEAIFKELSPGTGFSGFSMRGKAKLEDGKPSIKLTARSNRYNVWEWSRDFRGD